MTGQLLRVTTTPYQSVRLSQSARLVSSDSVDLERRKAIARMRAFQSQHSSGGGFAEAGYDFVNQINRTFSVKQQQSSVPKSSAMTENVPSGSSSSPVVSAPPKEMVAAETASTQVSLEEAVVSPDIQAAAVSAESNSAYTMERGAFEFRVVNGEITFLPSLMMTVMTQRPEVHFEYLGGHNYVPPEKFDDNGVMNLLA